MAAHWLSFRRTAFRDQAKLREACPPTMETPAPIFDDTQAPAHVRSAVTAMKDFEDPLRRGTPRIDKEVMQIGLLPREVAAAGVSTRNEHNFTPTKAHAP